MAKKKKQKSSKKRKKKSCFSVKKYLPLMIGLVVLLLDQSSKYLVDTYIPRMTHESQWYPYNGIGVFEDFFGIECSIVHTTNRGAAWGLFSEYQQTLLFFRAFFVTGLLIYVMYYNKRQELTLPLTLVIAGAAGNIIDVFVLGHVVDMIKCVFWGYHYPVFNIADSSIFIGVVSIILLPFFKNKNLSLKLPMG